MTKSGIFVASGVVLAAVVGCTGLARVSGSRDATDGGTVARRLLLADPSVYSENGTNYLIGTESGQLPEAKNGAVFPILRSTDGETWRTIETAAGESRVLSKEAAFGKSEFWAPQLFRHRGRYYFAYACDRRWGIAVADRVEGPYSPHAEFKLGGCDAIDPYVFFDDDGRVYAVCSDWNVGGIGLVELSSDLKKVIGESVLCVQVDQPWEKRQLEKRYEELNAKYAYGEWSAYRSADCVAEGPTLLKRHGKYVLFYSANDFRSPDYCVGVAVADRPQGPWKKLQDGPVISRAETGWNGTGHGDVFFDGGEMKYVFHVHNSPTAINPRRTGFVRMIETIGADGYPRYAADASSVRVASDVRIWPQPPEVPRSPDYEVSVEGSEVDVIGTTAEQMYLPEGAARPYSFASFSAEGEVTVDVTIKSTNVVMRGSAAVTPEKLGARLERLDANRARITLKAPCTAVFEPDGRHRALVLNVCAPERNPVKPDDPKVKYFGPGFHHLDQITLTDGETLYLAPGAWVESTVKAKGRDIAVRGPGVLSGACWAWQQGPTNAAGKVIQGNLVSLSGENITIKDSTLYSSFSWTLVLNGVTNAVVDSVKVLCGRVINDDGIDVCRAKDVVIRDSFVRAQDDCLAVKWWCENLLATNCAFWVDFANAVRIGYECEKPPLPMRNIRISDLDVIHLSLAKQPPTEYWGHSAFCVQASNGQTFEDISFDGVRIPAVEEGDNFLVARTMKINPEFKYHGGFSFDEPGYIRGLSFRDVTVEGATRTPVFLEEFDAAHSIEDFEFERVTGCGEITRVPKNGAKRVEWAERRTVPREYVARGGERLRYRWHEPAKAGKDERYPLVVFLHGAGERGDDNRAQLVHGVPDLIDYSERSGQPCFLIAGQVPAYDVEVNSESNLWANIDWTATTPIMPGKPSVPMTALIELVEKLIRDDPRIDPERVYATGVSMGGYGTWDLVMRRPGIFAAAMPLCGGADATKMSLVKKVPIRVIHGGADDVVNTERGRAAYAALKAAGGNVEYVEYPGVGHDCWTQTYSDDRMLDWLFSHRLIPCDPDLAVFLSDLHLNGVRQDPRRPERYQEANLRRTVDEILEMRPRPANVVVFGDLVQQWGDVEDYRLAKECLQPLADAGMKLTFGLGNHDRRASFFEVFPECDDSPVPGRAVSVVSMGNVDLIMLDTLKGDAAVGAPGPTEGTLDQAQADWLEQAMPAWKRPFFLCAHHPTWELKVNGKSMESVVMECDNAVGFIHGHRHHWSKEAMHRGYPSIDTKRRLGLPSAGFWGDIGYVVFRAGSEAATAELVQRGYWYANGGDSQHPSWAPMTEENQNQRCTFVYGVADR